MIQFDEHIFQMGWLKPPPSFVLIFMVQLMDNWLFGSRWFGILGGVLFRRAM